MNKREIMKVLRVCTLEHGGPSNAATVYGHHGRSRNCIRLHDADVWVYDPTWEAAR